VLPTEINTDSGVATRSGLAVPVAHRVNLLSRQNSPRLPGNSSRAPAGRKLPAEEPFAAVVFTITNLWAFGIAVQSHYQLPRTAIPYWVRGSLIRGPPHRRASSRRARDKSSLPHLYHRVVDVGAGRRRFFSAHELMVIPMP